MDVKKKEQPSPELEAAAIFQGALPQFKMLVPRLSKNGLKRLAIAMAEVPLNKEKVIFREKEEIDAFHLFNSIENAKFVMFSAALQERAATTAMVQGSAIAQQSLKEESQDGQQQQQEATVG